MLSEVSARVDDGWGARCPRSSRPMPGSSRLQSMTWKLPHKGCSHLVSRGDGTLHPMVVTVTPSPGAPRGLGNADGSRLPPVSLLSSWPARRVQDSERHRPGQQETGPARTAFVSQWSRSRIPGSSVGRGPASCRGARAEQSPLKAPWPSGSHLRLLLCHKESHSRQEGSLWSFPAHPAPTSSPCS